MEQLTRIEKKLDKLLEKSVSNEIEIKHIKQDAAREYRELHNDVTAHIEQDEKIYKFGAYSIVVTLALIVIMHSAEAYALAQLWLK